MASLKRGDLVRTSSMGQIFKVAKDYPEITEGMMVEVDPAYTRQHGRGIEQDRAAGPAVKSVSIQLRFTAQKQGNFGGDDEVSGSISSIDRPAEMPPRRPPRNRGRPFLFKSKMLKCFKLLIPKGSLWGYPLLSTKLLCSEITNH